MYNVYNRAEVEFERIREIGQEGKNSKAYLVHDKYLDAELVIKEISRSSFDNEDNFFSEARLLYKAAHAHVVQIQYACACSENIYIALPFYKNGSLKSLSENKSLTVRDIVRFSIQICSGLHNIHSKGLIHFDVKADNILLSDRNEALVSDFGLSKLMSSEFTATADNIYVKHIAPEHFLNTEFNVQYDIYQLGMTVYRLLVGESEFSRQLSRFSSIDELGAEVLAESFPDRLALEHIPSRLKRIVTRCLKVDLNERYQSVLEVANDLSVIDGNLIDWVYTNEDGNRVWHKKTATHEFLLEISSDGEALAQKKTVRGDWTRIRESCGTLNATRIREFLERY